MSEEGGGRRRRSFRSAQTQGDFAMKKKGKKEDKTSKKGK
jgi:hypothetical protein